MREIWSIEIRLHKVHYNIGTSILSQSQDLLHWVSYGKWPMVLKLRNSRIQCFKQITIWSWNDGDMTNQSNTVQKACCYCIAYEPNSFWLFGMNFGPLLLGSFWWQLGLLGFSIFINPIFSCMTIFGNLDFIQILITKYSTGSLKAMRKVSIYLFICFYYMLLINCICGLKIFWYS